MAVNISNVTLKKPKTILPELKPVDSQPNITKTSLTFGRKSSSISSIMAIEDLRKSYYDSKNTRVIYSYKKIPTTTIAQ